MDCFFDGNRTIRVVDAVHEGVNHRYKANARCICTRDFVLPACGPMIRAGNKPIARYMASANVFRELLSLVRSVYIVPIRRHKSCNIPRQCLLFVPLFLSHLSSRSLNQRGHDKLNHVDLLIRERTTCCIIGV